MKRSSDATATMTAITDLDVDALAHCARHLTLQDVSNMAMSCKFLKGVAYSDFVWHRLFRERWPQLVSSRFSTGVREAYLARLSALQQFKFTDPLVVNTFVDAKPYNHILLDKNLMVLSKGSSIEMLKLRSSSSSSSNSSSQIAVEENVLNGHNARVTCMRFFPSCETSLFRSETGSSESFLVSSSCDRTIRVWWKGSCIRCFRGHSSPVLTLSEKLLDDENGKLLASGGEDGTVRVWSLSSSGKRGQHSLKATFYGHGKPVKFVSVAGHKTSLLVSMSIDSKIRVWDVTTSSTAHSPCCVGTTSVSGAPVSMKCHESMLYVAAGSHAVAIDLRIMQKVATVAISQSKLYSFSIMPSKSLICTGEDSRAMLWDVRKNQDNLKPKPIAELDGHMGPVDHLYMDSYKVVTGGREDVDVNVWEADTGRFTNSLSCSPEDMISCFGCSAIAVDGCRIVTAAHGQEGGVICFRDFTNACSPISVGEDEHSSKFWDPQSYCDSDEINSIGPVDSDHDD